MYLKSLELQGFKSFPDKYKLEFDKGLTGVVGPNGSGKSNIGDAMRWVMGEQSSKTLRGAKMEDVIFSGTETRKAVGFAQVTLNIDNCDRALNVDSDMVSVSRKLYRNGDSEYMINGAGVRLKDIVELFMDTGLGRDGYSIIGQGRIAEIVSSKSADRREIFEEAAGISKFRYKKEEAERRLASAEDNIVRLNDIIGELEVRVEPLRVQSEKAKKFIELDSEKRKLEISVWVKKLDELSESILALDDKLLVSNGEYENLSRELDELDELVETCYKNRAKTTENIDALKEEIHKVELDNSNANSDIAVLENDIKHINESIETIRNSISQADKLRAEIENNIAFRNNENARLDEETNKTADEISQVENTLLSLSQKSDEFDKKVSESNAELNALYVRKSELNYKSENAKNTISEMEEETELLVLNIKTSEEELSNVNIEKKELVSAVTKVEEEISEHNNKLNGYQLLHKKRSEQLEELSKSCSDKEIRIREITQRVNVLNDLENSLEGFNRSTKQVLKASKQGTLRGIYGSVAQLVSVEPEYSLAVETALGAGLQNIVVENEDVAKRGIRLLKETNSGRATFLPLTSVKGNALNQPELKDEEGYVALASEIVKFDSKYSGVVNQLLGRIAVCENIDLATVIAKKYGYKFKIVTLDGQVINVGGSFTGGSSSKSAGILTRKNEIEDLNKEISKLENEYASFKEKRENLNQEVSKLFYDIEGEKEFIATLNGDKIRFEGELKRVRELVSQYENTLDEAETKLEIFKSKLISANEEINNSQSELSILNVQISEYEEKIRSSHSLIENTKADREEISDRLSQLKIRLAELNKDKETNNEAILKLNEDVKTTFSNKSDLENQITNLEKEISDKTDEISTVKERLDGSGDVIESINRKIIEEQLKYNKYDEQAGEYRHSQRVKNEEKETVSKEITRVTEKKNTVQNDYDKIISELWEQYEMTRSDAQTNAEKIEDMSEASRRLTELKTKIRGLGTVNVSAIEEYAEVSERYEFMSVQLNDVLKSKAELEKIIFELTENMREIFTENFNKINNNFKRIFTELFGGGKAELLLTDPDNVLECGIDIVVAPPGKVIKNLSLLSGGEQSFVAICIYFAILKIRPSPFCLLDEIEAALDDVNVSKYAQYLRNFTDTTQFILITHRRGTMEEADVLYGVTMQEKGVSKLLKMNVSDAADLDEN
ncbi:MAG: chromosome segregation protein SMC [Ruminococcus sp.]|nr:chromosome segregation protein SMC [Ruminococcus sp.]